MQIRDYFASMHNFSVVETESNLIHVISDSIYIYCSTEIYIPEVQALTPSPLPLSEVALQLSELVQAFCSSPETEI